jgi:hypothetical protein
MLNGDTTVRENVAVVVRGTGLVESVTVTVKENVPTVVGVPLITPVDGLMLNPVGRWLADQVNGADPPVAFTVAV